MVPVRADPAVMRGAAALSSVGHAKYGMIGRKNAGATPEARGLARRFAARAEDVSGRRPGRDGLCDLSGSAWRQARVGQAAEGAGGGCAGGLSDHRGDTFRSVYTVRFADRVFVLHAFQKKSKSGIATPKADIELIKERLKQAIEISRKKE